MTLDWLQESVGEAASSHLTENGLNGARPAVGVADPEDAMSGLSTPAAYSPHTELDDYDDGRLAWPTDWDLPPDQDVGETFADVIDVGETPQEHQGRSDCFSVPASYANTKPMIDN